MWAYESVFYQIYPLGFCGAPFENDGVLEHRIEKVNDWIPHIKKLGPMPFIFLRYLSRTHMDTIPEIIQRLIPAWVQMRISQMYATICTKKESAWYLTVYSTMWEEGSGHLRMF